MPSQVVRAVDDAMGVTLEHAFGLTSFYSGCSKQYV